RALGEIAARISAAERRAMKAERETNDRLIAHFLADRIGATFSGRISGVTRAGLFVKLAETGADGFIPARTLGADYYRYNEARHALIGDHTGESYRLGDAVTGVRKQDRSRNTEADRAEKKQLHDRSCRAPHQGRARPEPSEPKAARRRD